MNQYNNSNMPCKNMIDFTDKCHDHEYVCLLSANTLNEDVFEMIGHHSHFSVKGQSSIMKWSQKNMYYDLIDFLVNQNDKYFYYFITQEGKVELYVDLVRFLKLNSEERSQKFLPSSVYHQIDWTKLQVTMVSHSCCKEIELQLNKNVTLKDFQMDLLRQLKQKQISPDGELHVHNKVTEEQTHKEYKLDFSVFYAPQRIGKTYILSSLIHDRKKLQDYWDYPALENQTCDNATLIECPAWKMSYWDKLLTKQGIPTCVIHDKDRLSNIFKTDGIVYGAIIISDEIMHEAISSMCEKHNVKYQCNQNSLKGVLNSFDDIKKAFDKQFILQEEFMGIFNGIDMFIQDNYRLNDTGYHFFAFKAIKKILVTRINPLQNNDPQFIWNMLSNGYTNDIYEGLSNEFMVQYKMHVNQTITNRPVQDDLLLNDLHLNVQHVPLNEIQKKHDTLLKYSNFMQVIKDDPCQQQQLLTKFNGTHLERVQVHLKYLKNIIQKEQCKCTECNSELSQLFFTVFGDVLCDNCYCGKTKLLKEDSTLFNVIDKSFIVTLNDIDISQTIKFGRSINQLVWDCKKSQIDEKKVLLICKEQSKVFKRALNALKIPCKVYNKDNQIPQNFKGINVVICQLDHLELLLQIRWKYNEVIFYDINNDCLRDLFTQRQQSFDNFCQIACTTDYVNFKRSHECDNHMLITGLTFF